MFNFRPQIPMTIEIKKTLGVDLSLNYDYSCLLVSVRDLQNSPSLNDPLGLWYTKAFDYKFIGKLFECIQC